VTEPIRQRVRLRFAKTGDFRFTGHRDVSRAFERLFRRAGLRLGMSEGFHPKPRMMFPLALSLGIAACEEVMEFELAEHVEAGELLERLRDKSPPGLEICSLRLLAAGEPKAKIEHVTYEITIPADRADPLAAAIDEFLSEPHHYVERDGAKAPIDVRCGLTDLRLNGSVLRFTQAVSRTASARPREILAAIGALDLEQLGHILTRTHVRLAESMLAPKYDGGSLASATTAGPSTNRKTDYEKRDADQRGAIGGMPNRDH